MPSRGKVCSCADLRSHRHGREPVAVFFIQILLAISTNPARATGSNRPDERREQRMQKREITISNRLGLHARAAAKLVTLCTRFQSRVELVVNGRRANARQFVALIMLSASLGAKVAIEVSGPDELKAFTAVTRLISDGFGEG